LFINYQFNSRHEEAGTAQACALFHETETAIQFEHGEFGFKKIQNVWQPVNYDVTDEMKALKAGSIAPFTTTMINGENTFQGSMNSLDMNLSDQKVIEKNREIIGRFYPPNHQYMKLKTWIQNNPESGKIFTNREYKMRPYKPRQ
jgi:hypothetical protein